MSDWDLDRTVAQGSYGQVSLATYKRNRDVQVAIKRYRITEDAESEEKSELLIHQRLCGGVDRRRHVNIAQLLSHFTHDGHMYIVLEYAVGGTLRDLMAAKQDGRFRPEEVCLYLRQLLDGLHHMHRLEVMHGDLKLSNLLLGADGNLKICDFGLSRYLRSSSNSSDRLTEYRGFHGCAEYAAPEVFHKHRAWKALPVDVWSCGIIFIVFATGRKPWSSAQWRTAAYRDWLSGRHGERFPWHRSFAGGGGAARDLLLQMLVPRPDRRATVAQLRGHRYLLQSSSPSLTSGSPESGGNRQRARRRKS